MSVREHHFKFISPYFLMLFTSVYAVIANIVYMAVVLKEELQTLGRYFEPSGLWYFSGRRADLSV
jgi:hypothetical protein